MAALNNPSSSSEFLHHEPCQSCRSNGHDQSGDNLARYSDGHGYCHACGRYEGGVYDGDNIQKENNVAAKALNLLPDGECRALTKRGLTEETCRKFGYSSGKDGVKSIQIAPYYDKNNNLIAQHVRYGPEKGFSWRGKSKDALLFGQHLWRNQGGRRIVITEGELDCLSISQIQDNKWPVVSIKSGASGARADLMAQLEWLESFQEIVLAFDMDEVGQKAAQECALLFTPGKARIAWLPEKDASDCLMNNKHKELVSAIWDAKVFRPDGILNGQELKIACKTPPVKGAATPFAGLDAKTMGIRPGELVLFTAGSGIGKTTVVREIAFHLHQAHGWPLGVIALEEAKEKTARTFVGLKLNKPYYLPDCVIDEAEFDEAFDATVGRGDWWIFDHWGSTDIDILLSKIRYLAVGLGVKCVILDHISIVVSGLETEIADERKTIDLLMTRLRSLIQETGISLLAVVHVKRPDKGKGWNEGREINLTDLRGSGSLEQLSDIVIALERNQQGDTPNVSRIRVLKNRPIGDCGKAGAALWVPETGRLIPYEIPDDTESPFTNEEKPDDGKGDF